MWIAHQIAKELAHECLNLLEDRARQSFFFFSHVPPGSAGAAQLPADRKDVQSMAA